VFFDGAGTLTVTAKLGVSRSVTLSGAGLLTLYGVIPSPGGGTTVKVVSGGVQVTATLKAVVNGALVTV